VCTDLGTLRRRGDGTLHLAAVPAGPEPLAARVRRIVDTCGWALQVDREVEELPTPTTHDARRFREYDRRGTFLGRT
jgi:hypothetical protein